MFSRLSFYLRYAAQNLWRNKRWTIFAIFCIGAGVSTIVALRSLGFAITDSLITNARASNHGDITYTAPNTNSLFAFDTDSEASSIPLPLVAEVTEYIDSIGGQVSSYRRAGNFQVTQVEETTAGRPQMVSALLIDPATFPPTEPVIAQEPAGAELRDLLTEPRSIVISRNLADTQNIRLGDEVRVTGTEERFTVTGIVSTDYEANLTDIFAAFFGFAYIHVDDAPTLQIPPEPNTISITLPPDADLDEVEMTTGRMGMFRYENSTIDDVLRRNQIVGDLFGRFIVIMGLGALLIGGVGIINTMLVMVGRRTNEIAAFKTFGLKGRQISMLFMAEAFWLGVAGSLFGTVVGVLMGGIVNRFGEAVLQQRLPVAIYPEAVFLGLAIGIVVTLVFGVLPVLTANRVRPATILRPNETVIPATGCLHSIFALFLVIIVVGAIVGSIVGSPVTGLEDTRFSNILVQSIITGMIGVAITLLILGILVCLLWVVIWIVGKLPYFGIVDLRLALRNLSSRRIRNATTMLALSAGMFALSLITFVGIGTREVLQIQLAQSMGGNVMVFPLISILNNDLAQGLLNAQLNSIEGIEYRTEMGQLLLSITEVDGVSIDDLSPEQGSFTSSRRNVPMSFGVRTTDNPNLTSGTIVAGRDLTSADTGMPYVVLSNLNPYIDSWGIQVGSQLTAQPYNDERAEPVLLEVIGIAESSNALLMGQSLIAPGVFPPEQSFQMTFLQVTPENLNSVLLALSTNPTLFTLDITFIDGLMQRMISLFSAIPTLVSILSIIAAAIAMTNTISLATLERRQHIGVMKAIGLKPRRVLGIILIENTIIGFLSGLIGIGLSGIGISLIISLSGADVPIPRDATLIGIGLLAISVLISWIATFLAARPATMERVSHVLRYE